MRDATLQEVLVSLRAALALELRVATSRNVQPVWFRVVKWIVIASVATYFWRAPFFWPSVAAITVVAVGLHLLWRTKTRRWTRPWWGWNDVATAHPRPREDEPRV